MDLDQLLALARGGDPQARNDLLQLLRPFVRAFFGRRVGQDSASDLTQDAQLRMDQGLARFRGVGWQLLPWSRRIAARIFCDYLARRGLSLDSLPADVPCPRTEDDGRLVRAEEMALLRQALEDLPEQYRVVIEARLFEGLPPVAIAQRLGCPPSTVRVYSKRAVEMLSARLRGQP
jgi:RNA polymerase sigma-70 factor (ECF subfamily)